MSSRSLLVYQITYSWHEEYREESDSLLLNEACVWKVEFHDKFVEILFALLLLHAVVSFELKLGKERIFPCSLFANNSPWI
jgi:hypothetical protein